MEKTREHVEHAVNLLLLSIYKRLNYTVPFGQHEQTHSNWSSVYVRVRADTADPTQMRKKYGSQKSKACSQRGAIVPASTRASRSCKEVLISKQPTEDLLPWD
jgi:hypothetical protein